MRARSVWVGGVGIAVCSVLAWSADDLPPGKMQAKVKASCTQCHTVANITKKTHNRAEWSKILDKMTGYGADVDDKDRDAIIDYLTANFGPGKTTGSKPAKDSE